MEKKEAMLRHLTKLAALENGLTGKFENGEVKKIDFLELVARASALNDCFGVSKGDLIAKNEDGKANVYLKGDKIVEVDETTLEWKILMKQ